MFKASENAEDIAPAGARDIENVECCEKDVVVGISAAGGARYVISALEKAKELGIDMVITGIMSEKGSKGKKYPRMNASTFLQRASGMLLILFTALHIAGATGAMTPPPAVHAVVPVLFFAIAMLHAAVSTGKAFITLGIGDAKVFKAADVAVKVICGVTLVADVIGFYLHVC